MTDEAIEQEIQAKGLTAPRVTPQTIEDTIIGQTFFIAADAAKGLPQDAFEDHSPFRALKLLTICVLVLRNGFTVTGESACASPDNFDAELGRKIARQKAVEKIWPLEGYLLRQKLHDVA